ISVARCPTHDLTEQLRNILGSARLSGRQMAPSFFKGTPMTNSAMRLAIASLALTCAAAPPANADLLVQKSLSAQMAVTLATEAIAACKAASYAVSVTVVGRNGEPLIQLRGDGTGPHTMENSFKKAFTSRTFRIPSGEMEDRLKKNPQIGAQYLTGFTTGRA